MLLERIDAVYPKFSKGQRLIAAFIRENYDKAAFMTAAKLGKTVGVSESTVVRFATEIGFDGYPALQKALQEMIRNKLTSVQRMEVANERLGGADVLTKVLQTDVDTIKRTLDVIDSDMFAAAVKDIIASKKVFVMGVRSAAALSEFMYFYFTHIFEDVRKIDTASTSVIFEQILRISEQDVFIGITFSRYSRRTLKAATFAKNSGAKVIAITDSMSAPIAKLADHVLIAKSDMASFVDSLVAPLSVINALIIAIGLEKSAEVSKTYARLEEIWDEYNVYEKDGESSKNAEAD